MDPSKRYLRKKKINLEKLSEEQLLELIDSVESDEDIFDSDDNVIDPDYFVDSIEPEDSDEVIINECLEQIQAAESTDVFIEAINTSLNISEIENQLPSASSALVEAQIHNIAPIEEAPTVEEATTLEEAPVIDKEQRFKTAKRPRSPLPRVESSGPTVRPNNGGFTGKALSDVSKNSKKLIWRKKPLTLHVNEVAFRGKTSLPLSLKRLKTPMELFNYFFNDDIIDIIVAQTNNCALEENINTTFRTNRTEIRHYIGILLYMSIYRYPNLESYSGRNGFAAIQNCMPFRRFETIKQYLAFQDESQRKKKGEAGYDPLFRIRELATKLNERFDSVPKTARLCIDEQIITTKTQHHLRQYMPNKPHKWGVKLFVLCDSNGYAYRFEIYNGAGDHVILPDCPDLGATSNVVVRLSQTIPDFIQHIIYFDNFYTSLPLLVYLRARGIYSLGTQFFYHDFPKSHQSTTRRKVYKNCLVCDTCIRELMVLDVPPQKRFPADNFAEWNNGHPLGLRTVHAYVLVFDMGNLQTFQYCRSMRDQILDSFSHRDFSIIVVGNKYDAITEAQANAQELKDISTLVRKHWRCGYVECSAQYNYKIGDVFRELMGCTGGNSAGGIMGTEFSQSNRNKGRCTIL